MFKKLMCGAFALVLANAGSAATGFLQAEQGSGLNKICYYEGTSGAFTKTVSSTGICPQTADDGRGTTGGISSSDRTSEGRSTSSSSSGLLSGERSSGLNKTCFYNGPRGTFTKTISSSSACPQSASQ